jgi:hypothetical protein
VLPPIDLSSCSGSSAVTLTFTHWYDFEQGGGAYDNYDGANVEAFCGGSWQLVHPEGGYPDPSVRAAGSRLNGDPGYSCVGTEGTWHHQVFRIEGCQDPDFQIRFCMGADGSTTEAGWYIDEIAVSLGDPGGFDPACFPPFEGTSSPLPNEIRDLMTGLSYRDGCPVGLDDLRLLDMTHWNFDGAVAQGEMVVAATVANDVLDTFHRLYDARFPIERMRLVDYYDADDDLSMADNNTSAFNCRTITGGSGWSRHSYGDAIDINPVQNPYVKDATVLPPAGSAYLERSDVRQGMIVDPGVVTDAFDLIFWTWGGDWSSLKDYQHFQGP